MYCTPCARLMKSITPNTSVSPAAIRNSSTPSCRPLRVWTMRRVMLMRPVSSLAPPSGYRIHTSRLCRTEKADSIDQWLICGSGQCLESNLAWDCSGIGAYKKGGPFASGAGAAARLAHPTACWHPRTADSVYPLGAQSLGERKRDGAVSRKEDCNPFARHATQCDP